MADLGLSVFVDGVMPAHDQVIFRPGQSHVEQAVALGTAHLIVEFFGQVEVLRADRA